MDVEQLIEAWRAPLTALHAGMGAPWRDARELAQDTIVEAYLARDRLRGDPGDPATVGPWLRGIARHLNAAWRRRRTRVVPVDPEHAAGPDGEPTEDPRAAALRAEMERLPEELRTVLYLRYLEETPVREVAALLGLGEKTVEGRLYRARARLRDRMAQTAKE